MVDDLSLAGLLVVPASDPPAAVGSDAGRDKSVTARPVVDVEVLGPVA